MSATGTFAPGRAAPRSTPRPLRALAGEQIAVAHEAKLAGLGRRLCQPVVPPAGPPEAMAQTILRAIDHPPAPRAAIEREKRLAHDQMALLRVLLSGGRSDEAALVGGLELAPEAWVA